MKQKFLDALRPMVIPELDPAFRPAALSQRALENCLESSSSLETVHLALVRPDQSVYRFKITLLPDVPEHAELNTFLLERQIKFLLWSRERQPSNPMLPLPFAGASTNITKKIPWGNSMPP